MTYRKLKYITLAPEVAAALPVTDVRHMLEEIDKERHIKAVIKESRSRYNQYMNNLRHRK